MKDIDIRISIKNDDINKVAAGRLCDDYHSGIHGKGVLIQQCVKVGYLAKEAGLSEILALLDEPKLSTMTALERQKYLRQEIAIHLGLQVATVTQEKPIETIEQKKEIQPVPRPLPSGFGA